MLLVVGCGGSTDHILVVEGVESSAYDVIYIYKNVSATFKENINTIYDSDDDRL